MQSVLHGEVLSVIRELALTVLKYIIVYFIEGVIWPSSKNHNCPCVPMEVVKLLMHVRSLENLDIDNNQYGEVITPWILSRLPQEIRLEWSRESADHEVVAFMAAEVPAERDKASREIQNLQEC